MHYKLLIAALLFVSCADGSMPSAEPDAPQAVNFSVYVGQQGQTRSGATGEITLANLPVYNFGVYAYYTKTADWSTFAATTDYVPDFMYNQEIIRTSVTTPKTDSEGNPILDALGNQVVETVGRWTYTPVKYWPNGSGTAEADGMGTEEHKVSFFAYAPYVGVVTEPLAADGNDPTADTSSGITHINASHLDSRSEHASAPVVAYSLAPSVAAQVDLLYAKSLDRTKQAVGDSVIFKFQHALSCIEVYVQRVYNLKEPAAVEGDDDATKIFVCNLELKGNLPVSGKLDVGSGEWFDVAGTPTPCTFTIDETMVSETLRGTVSTDADVIRSTELDNWGERDGVVKEAQRLTTSRVAAMFIPSGDITFTPTLTYDFVTHDDELILGLKDSDGGRYARIPNEIEGKPFTLSSVEPGKIYRLVCYIGVETVEFVVVGVEDWDFPIRFYEDSVTPFTPGTPNEKTLGEDD